MYYIDNFDLVRDQVKSQKIKLHFSSSPFHLDIKEATFKLFLLSNKNEKKNVILRTPNFKEYKQSIKKECVHFFLSLAVCKTLNVVLTKKICNYIKISES